MLPLVILDKIINASVVVTAQITPDPFKLCLSVQSDFWALKYNTPRLHCIPLIVCRVRVILLVRLKKSGHVETSTVMWTVHRSKTAEVFN